MKSLKELIKQRIMEDMAFDTAGLKASEARVRRAEGEERRAESREARAGRGYVLPQGHPARAAAEQALAQHIAMGSSDIVYTHDPATDTFRAILNLPRGLSHKLAADAMRFSEPGLKPADALVAVDVANRIGGLHGVADWDDSAYHHPMDMNYTVPPGVGLGRRVTNPARATR